MEITIQETVYVAEVRQVRETIMEVADFSIPSDRIPASLATEAGMIAVSTGPSAWDVLAAPTATGQYPAANLGLAKKVEWVSPSANARIVQFCLNGPVALTVTDKATFRVPAAFNGLNLVAVTAHCGVEGASGASSSGNPTFTIQRGGANMLSTNLTIDQGEYDSATAAAAAVIDTAEDDIATGEEVIVECSVAGTGVTYAIVTCVFS